MTPTQFAFTKKPQVLDYNLIQQIEAIKKEETRFNTHTKKFYSLIKKLTLDHYGWIRAQKFSQILPIYKPSQAWVSPTASNSRKFDFFTAEAGGKVSQSAQKSVIIANSSATKQERNDFFMDTLSGYQVSNDGESTARSRIKKVCNLQSLEDSI